MKRVGGVGVVYGKNNIFFNEVVLKVTSSCFTKSFLYIFLELLISIFSLYLYTLMNPHSGFFWPIAMKPLALPKVLG